MNKFKLEIDKAEIRNLFLFILIFLCIPGFSQGNSPLKQSEPDRVNGDTIFIFSNEKLFFQAKKKDRKLIKIREVKPTADSSSVIIFNFNLIKDSANVATLYNPFPQNLYFTIYVWYDGEKGFVKTTAFYAPAFKYSPMVWNRKVKCIKVHNLRFKNL